METLTLKMEDSKRKRKRNGERYCGIARKVGRQIKINEGGTRHVKEKAQRCCFQAANRT